MSREARREPGQTLCFPRASGDEPVTRLTPCKPLTFSPRERG